jgi:AcrR family transcriptional regulator
MTLRLTRPQQVERNRSLLLDAARRTFLARGYAGATIDAIAEEAGFSKGVVYSQFSGKADLFLALLEERVGWRAAENDRLVEDHPGPGVLVALLRSSERRSTEDAGWARLLIEFRVAATRDPEVNDRYAALHAHSVARLAACIQAALGKDGVEPVFPPHTFAQLIFALNSGAILEQAADPSALPFARLEELLSRLVTPH